MNDDLKKLIEYIMEWWKEVEYDTCGLYGEYNVYDEKPSFVEYAKYLKDEKYNKEHPNG